MVGGAELSHPDDCCVYLLDAGDLVVIDSGAGASFDRLVANITKLGFDPKKIKTVIATHAHIDHVGSLHQFQKAFGARIVAHEIDAQAIERGSGVGAEFYGVNYVPCHVDQKIHEAEDSLTFGDITLKTLHVPGHTPGSVVAYVDIDRKRILFGQDIHGPYYAEWGADMASARESLQKLIDLKADILCEGHFGIYQPGTAVESYIRGYLNSL